VCPANVDGAPRIATVSAHDQGIVPWEPSPGEGFRGRGEGRQDEQILRTESLGEDAHDPEEARITRGKHGDHAVGFLYTF
jgi:hypothetical protein